MKKTFTINLAGSVYHIDEDAYTLLEHYLRSLREYFLQEDAGNEIVSDIELRISELFSEYLHDGKEVVSIEQVEEVINRVGSPEEMDNESGEEKPSDSFNTTEEGRGKRRFFRDPTNKVLGGVLSGIACYFNWKVTTVRVVFILLTAFGLFWGTLSCYLILWFIFPEAKTTAEKLSMKGENVTIENIGKSVTKGFEQVNHYLQLEQTQSRIQQVGEKTIRFIGTLIQIAFIGICVLLIPILISFLLAAIAFLVAAVMALNGFTVELLSTFPYFDWNIISKAPSLFIGGSIIALFLSGLPLVILIHSTMRYFGKTEAFSMGTKLTLFILWLVAWIAMASLITHAVALKEMDIW